MSNKDLDNQSTEKKFLDVTQDPNSSTATHQAFMSEGLREWLRDTSTQNQSGESLDTMLPRVEEQRPRSTSAVSRARSHRPRLHSRKTSRGSKFIRAKLSHQLSRKGTGIAKPKAMVASPKERFRITAVFPFLFSAAAFICSIVLVLAGSNAGCMTNVNIISFNTTNLGTGIVNFAVATSTSTTASVTSTTAGIGRRDHLASTTIPTTMTTTVLLPTLAIREAFNPLDPLGIIPVLSSVVVSRASVDSSILASAGSAIASQFPAPSISLPSISIPSGLASGNGTGILGSLGSFVTDGLTSLLSSLVAGLGASTLTQAIDDSLNSAIADLIASFISRAGVQDYYSMYVLTTCQGRSSHNISSCHPFSTTAQSISNVSAKVPSSLVVLGTNVSSPALGELTDAISSLGPTVSSFEKFFLALMILSLINSALATLLSFLGILFPTNRIILYFNVSLTSIGILTRSIDAVLATTLSVTLNWATNKFGNTVGVSSRSGGLFIALIWLGLVFQGLASTYWVCVWFVEFRQVSFRVRRREAVDVGDYRGILREIKADVKLEKVSKEQEEGVVIV